MEWDPTGPPMVFGKRGPRPIGKGPPDRHATYYTGQSIWFEIKKLSNKDRESYGQRLHQYERLLAYRSVNVWAFYLCLWRHDSYGDEWRIYPIEQIEVAITGKGDYGYSLIFERAKGLLVPAYIKGRDWLPDWLPTIREYYGGDE